MMFGLAKSNPKSKVILHENPSFRSRLGTGFQGRKTYQNIAMIMCVFDLSPFLFVSRTVSSLPTPDISSTARPVTYSVVFWLFLWEVRIYLAMERLTLMLLGAKLANAE